MGFLKKNKDKNSINNWYEDRYSAILIQRNFLILFSTFMSLSIIIALIVIKNFQENKSIEPFLIEYDKNTGMMTTVDFATKKEYTAQEAVKESYVIQYLKYREVPKLTVIEDIANFVRVMSAPNIYDEYLAQLSQDLALLRNSGKVTDFKINITSMVYLSSSKVDIKFNKILTADDNIVFTKPMRVILNFVFADIDSSIDDLRLNPLGFQINYYKIIEEKNVLNQNGQ